MRFGVIYWDPPWAFTTWDKRPDALPARSMEQHYGTMTDERLLGLDLSGIVADDCVMLMWATWPKLPFALELGKALGFEYKTVGFVWAKTTRKTALMNFILNVCDKANWHFGLGYWTRANTEFCLLFTKGHPDKKDSDVRQLVVWPVMRHSEKPPLHQDIERLIGGPYIELFARRQVEGWVCLGNDLDGLDIQESVNRVASIPVVEKEESQNV